MDKPKESMKVIIKNSDSFEDYSSVKYDNKVLKWMEFKMRRRYNTGKLSKYMPTRDEQEVLRRNLENVILSHSYPDSFAFTMINAVSSDIKAGTLLEVNKRALVMCIDAIRNFWINKYPDNVFKKEKEE